MSAPDINASQPKIKNSLVEAARSRPAMLIPAPRPVRSGDLGEHRSPLKLTRPEMSQYGRLVYGLSERKDQKRTSAPRHYDISVYLRRQVFELGAVFRARALPEYVFDEPGFYVGAHGDLGERLRRFRTTPAAC
jgi:hypothetical protein